ncbi:esterase-like activity of phytase family protein [Catenuloplanes japonicus]|uniref:esterase-like activity of phytase family protein n=1 Tax=Catenuloplanes japonicus TaxID=33876 RepID=UPI0005250E5E|nr:esterase-like activity of phytase family protein [Catenuloplanes japonicus]
MKKITLYGYAVRALLAIGAFTVTLAFAGAPAHADDNPVTAPTLTGWAGLAPETFVPGSIASGAALGKTAIHGIPVPWKRQPVQGFSGLLHNKDGTFDALSDNGYGSRGNSADFLLRIHKVRPDQATGTVDVLGGVNLTDPDRHVPWRLTRKDRTLTGADFDPESIARDGNGGYWIGDEFGPYLLHVDGRGRLLAAPVPMPGVIAPETADRTGEVANLPSSKGIEGLAASPDGRHLYALLEGTVDGDGARDLRLTEFDTRSGQYTGVRYTYRLEAEGMVASDVVAVDANRFLVIEHDGGLGANAETKRIYLADRRSTGVMSKSLVTDLMQVANPQRLGDFRRTFSFPVQPEGLVVLDDYTLGVVNDNNFPGSAGRYPGVADSTEFLTIRLPKALSGNGY